MTIDPSADVRIARRVFAAPAVPATETEWAAIERLRRDFPDTLKRIEKETA